jgi:hypothetical protein
MTPTHDKYTVYYNGDTAEIHHSYTSHTILTQALLFKYVFKSLMYG